MPENEGNEGKLIPQSIEEIKAYAARDKRLTQQYLILGLHTLRDMISYMPKSEEGTKQGLMAIDVVISWGIANVGRVVDVALFKE